MKASILHISLLVLAGAVPAIGQTAPDPHKVDAVREWHKTLAKSASTFPLEFQLDLNNDSVKEIFLATEIGSRGHSYSLFRKAGSRYNLIGEDIQGGRYPFEITSKTKGSSWGKFRGFQSSSKGTTIAYPYEYDPDEEGYVDGQSYSLSAAEEAKYAPPPPPKPGKDIGATVDAIEFKVDGINARLHKSSARWASIEQGGTVTALKTWYDANDSLIKAQDDSGGGNVEDLTEYFFNSAGELIYVFKRTSTTTSARGTRLREEHHFFQDGRLIRTRFRSGTKADIASARDEITDPNGKGDGGYSEFRAEARLISTAVSKGRPGPGPAPKPSTAATVRWLDGTKSPNGKYSLGWAPASGKASDVGPDNKLRDPKIGAKNYLVDIGSNKILATTKGTDHPNSDWSSVVWSRDSRFVIETTQAPASTTGCSIWCVGGGTAGDSVDLFNAAKAALFDQMKADEHPSFEAHGAAFLLVFDAPKIDEDGEVIIHLEGRENAKKKDAHDFQATITLELETRSGNQLRLVGTDVQLED